MFRRWVSGVLAAAVVVVGVFAGVDAFRSLGDDHASRAIDDYRAGEGTPRGVRYGGRFLSAVD